MFLTTSPFSMTAYAFSHWSSFIGAMLLQALCSFLMLEFFYGEYKSSFGQFSSFSHFSLYFLCSRTMPFYFYWLPLCLSGFIEPAILTGVGWGGEVRKKSSGSSQGSWASIAVCEIALASTAPCAVRQTSANWEHSLCSWPAGKALHPTQGCSVSDSRLLSI